jgi:hypothetical protein
MAGVVCSGSAKAERRTSWYVTAEGAAFSTTVAGTSTAAAGVPQGTARRTVGGAGSPGPNFTFALRTTATRALK